MSQNRNYYESFINELNPEACMEVAENIAYKLETENNYPNLEKDKDILKNYMIGLSKIYKMNPYYRIITEDKVISMIYKLLKLKLLPKDIDKEFNQIFDVQLHRKEMKNPDMQRYEEYLVGKSMDDDMLGDFLEDILLMNFKNGKIDMKYLEYLVGELLCKYSNVSNVINLDQKKIILEDFATQKIKALTDVNILALYSSRFLDEKEGASYFNGVISISEDILRNPRILGNLIGLFHEIGHVKQCKSLGNIDYDHALYIIEKEMLIGHYDKEFYQTNYNYMYVEIDAEYFSFNTLLNFLKTLKHENFKKEETYKKILEIITNRKNHTLNKFNGAKQKVIDGKKVENVEEYFDSLILKEPKILEERPIFRIEYNKDGTRKSLDEILSDYISVARIKKNRLGNYDLYKYILLTRSTVDIDECLKIVDMDIPMDLSDTTIRVIQKLRYAVISRIFDKVNNEEKEIIARKARVN